MSRPYEEIAAGLRPDGTRRERMQSVVDALWNGLRDHGVSWVGFYVHEGGEELVCGPRRDKPACSPIGLHGACGRSFTTRAPFIVPDVAMLGANYIACDPRDRSEVVVPLLEADGRCWAVLDVDSHELAAFDAEDAAGLVRVLRAAGLA
jgi:putative methionine-R-sulfoxide reductase with GAF domain